MFTKLTLTMITLILLISLAGCSTTNTSNQNANGSSSTPNPSGTITDTIENEEYQMLPAISGNVANIKVDASANGTTQQLKQGEVMSLTLDTNPSTGYAWVPNISNTEVLMAMGEPEYQSLVESTTPIVGASEKVTFYFQATGTGTATLTLDYERSWEQGVAPQQTITITVEVQ